MLILNSIPLRLGFVKNDRVPTKRFSADLQSVANRLVHEVIDDLVANSDNDNTRTNR